jgi:arginyl-tRNA synthetase
MLDPEGNTAVYLFYSYVRINSIYEKAGLSEEDLNKLIETETITISDPKERQLLLHLLKFNDAVEEVFDDLSPSKLCDYLYGIATKFSEFYTDCKIIGDERMKSRILIVELTRRFMKLSFDLLGLTPVQKI